MAKNDSRRGRGEGALFYRADRDRWIARVIVDGQPRAVSAKTKTEARRKLDELRRLADGSTHEVLKNFPSESELIQRCKFCERHPNCRRCFRAAGCAPSTAGRMPAATKFGPRKPKIEPLATANET